MTEDDLADAINKAAERCTIAMHDALRAEGIPTTSGHLFATTMVFAVTMVAILTEADADDKTVASFKEGLSFFRDDVRRGGATLQ